MARWRFSLQTRLVSLVAGGLIAVTVLFGVLGLQAVARSTDRGLQEQLQIAQLLARHVDWVLNEHIQQLSVVAAAAQIDPRTHAVSFASQPVENQMRLSSAHGLATLGQDGALLWPAPADVGTQMVAAQGATEFRRAARDGQALVTTARVPGPTEERVLVGIAVPLPFGASTKAKLLLGILEEKDLPSILTLPEDGANYTAEIVDSEGLTVAGDRASAVAPAEEHSARFVAWINAGNPTVTTCHSCHEGDSRTVLQRDVLAFAPLAAARWGVAVRRPEAIVFAEAHELRRNLLFIGSTAIALVMLASIWTSRRLLCSLVSLTEAAQRIAAGDLGKSIAARGEDELAALARSFEHMRQRLQRSLDAAKEYQLDLERRVLERTADLELRNRELAAISMVATAASGELDLEHLLQRALERALEATGLPAGGLLLTQECDADLSYRVSQGFSPQFLLEFGSLKIGEGIAGRVALTGKPEIVSDISADPRLTKETVRREGLRAFASVPLVAGDQVLGVLNVAGREPGQIDPALVKILVSIGQQIGLAIERARLREEASKVKTLQELDQMKSQLLTMVSHELRTPLASIKGHASALLSEGRTRDERTVRHYVRGIDRDADQLRGLIDNLLDMSRIEGGALHLDVQPVDLILVAHRAVTTVRPMARHQQFVVRFPAEFPTVEGDPRRLEQVFRNLLENAAKYAPDQPVYVEGVAAPDEVLVSVTDSGPGIPRDKLNSVFQPFFRIEGHEHAEGIGLGLAICRGLVEAHNGRIWIESDTGCGCRVVIALPLTQAAGTPANSALAGSASRAREN